MFKKIYIYSFGCPKKLHSDNGTKFKNLLFSSFYNENNIKQIFSYPYTPKSHGAVEAAHKQLQRFVYDSFYTTKIKNDFNWMIFY